jgi:hypothetical protein
MPTMQSRVVRTVASFAVLTACRTGSLVSSKPSSVQSGVKAAAPVADESGAAGDGSGWQLVAGILERIRPPKIPDRRCAISAGATNIFIENNRMDSPSLDRALRLKSNARRGGVIDGVYFGTP